MRAMLRQKGRMVCAGLLAALAAGIAHAGTFAWNGAGADNNWSTSANWTNSAAPAAGDTLAFSGGTRTSPVNNLAADTAFTGFSFLNDYSSGKTAGFTLSGARVTLDGNVVTTVPSVNGTITDTISLNMLLSGTRTFTVNSATSKTHDLTVSGDIGETGGSQGLTKTGGGALTLSGANTYSGKTTVSAGTVNFNTIGNVGAASSALGAPATITDGTIDLNANLNYTGPASASDRVLNLTGGGGVFRNNGTGALILNGGITGSNVGVFFRGGQTITENGLIALGNGSVSRTDGGTLILTNPNNSFSGTLTAFDGTISVDMIADGGQPCPLGLGTRINIGQSNGTTGRLRYTGAGDASCNRVIGVETKDGNTTSGGILENATAGATLTLSGNVSPLTATRTPRLQLTGSGNGVLSGVISGTLSVAVNGTGTWTLSGANTYTGATIVSSGALFVNGSTAAGSAVAVASAATLGGTGTVNGAVSLTAGAKLVPGVNGIGTLAMGDGGAAALTLNGNTITCEVSAVTGICDAIAVSGTLVLNSANTVALSFPAGSAPAGTYTLMTYGGKSGGGTLTLDHPYPNVTLEVGNTAATLTIGGGGTAAALTWVGDGSANAWDTTTANWLPVLYGDNAVVVFDDTGFASPAVNITPDAVAPYSVTVNTSAKAYTFGGAAITGACGLTKSGTTGLTLNGANTYSGLTAINAGTLTLNGSLSNSTVSVSWGATLTETAGGVLAGTNLSLTNYGTAVLSGTNTYGGTTTVGLFGTSNITLTVNSDAALGSPSAGTTVNGGSANTENRLILGSGVTVTDETLTLNGGSGYRAGLRYTLGGGVGTWDGNVVIASGPCYIGTDNGGGTLVVGGSSADTITGASGSLSIRGAGTVVVNSRINIGGVAVNRDDAGTFVLNSTENALGAMNLAEGTLRLGASDALPANISLNIGKGSAINNRATLDLNGKSQQIGSLVENHYAGGGGWQRIFSADPATLIVSNETAKTFGTEGSTITGAVTLVKAGSGTLTLTGPNSTSGDFIVSNGTLVVSATGALGVDSTNIVVAAGTLTLQNSAAIADTAVLQIANGGGAKVSLASGVNETVDYLYYGDSQKRNGTYGATGSGADYTSDEHFSGTGILTVLRGHSGTVISLQ